MKKNIYSIIVLFSLIVILSLFLPVFNFSSRTLQAQDAGMELFTYFPLFGYHDQFSASTSYYLPTVDGEFLYNLGCQQGSRDLEMPDAQDSVAVLDFSYPTYDSNLGYGAALFGDTPAVSIPAIAQAVKRFAKGYYNCSGADNKSNLVIGVGTNNKSTSIKTETKATAHGKAWGSMISELNQWALDQRILHQVQFYGASNIESWNTPTWTYAWIAGFEQNDDVFMLHYGDAAGCPYDENPNWACSGEWTVDDIWSVSWGAPSALPLPLIYRTDGIQAKQWAYLSRFSVENHGYRMDFTGVFTNWQYCQQFPEYCQGSYGSPIDNTPEEAYQQMMNELNKDPATMQTLRWKTDIRWVRESEVTAARSTHLYANLESTTHPIYEEIEKIDAALQETDLRVTLRASLKIKYKFYQRMADRILMSQQAPAPKE